jgi:transketolase
MSALMKQRVVYVLTHDSIGLGEDGPTHQAVEQVSSLRLIPNMSLWRPCDAVETAVAWKAAIERRDGPTSLCLSRQNLPHQERTEEQLKNIARGGYVLSGGNETPDAIVIATGSEVALAMDAAKVLRERGKKIRVVSMPSVDVFEAQDAAYRESVLPSSVTARIAVEAGVTAYWYRYVGLRGGVVGIDTFGESAPAGDVFKHFGFTTDNVVKAVEKVLGK